MLLGFFIACERKTMLTCEWEIANTFMVEILQSFITRHDNLVGLGQVQPSLKPLVSKGFTVREGLGNKPLSKNTVVFSLSYFHHIPKWPDDLGVKLKPARMVVTLEDEITRVGNYYPRDYISLFGSLNKIPIFSMDASLIDSVVLHKGFYLRVFKEG